MKKAILSTLSYADIFDYPLKKEEIWEWLILDSAKRKPSSRAQVEGVQSAKLPEELKILINKGLTEQKEGFYYLEGREKTAEIRKRRKKTSLPKLKIAENVAGILRLIPWIKLIGITGGLARNNSDKDDDIDLFFITAKDRLWLTRGLIVLVLQFLGAYRRPGKITNMICPNMLVSEDNLEITPHDLYSAHEVCLMKPIFVREESYLKFLKANLWARKFLPNVRKWRAAMGDQREKLKIINHQSSIINFVEYLARRLQLWYMRKKKTTEVVTEKLIKFHPQDIKERVLQEYKERIIKF